MRVVLAALCCCLLWVLPLLPAAAQWLPDPADEAWLRQRERDAQLRREQEARTEVRLQPAAAAPLLQLPATESPCVRIDRLVFEGAAAPLIAWLADAADHRGDGQREPVQGRCIGSDGVRILLQRLQQALLRRGYVTTRVLSPPQDLSAGVLRLTVLPGRVRTIRFSDETPARARMANAMSQHEGALLDLRALEQSLENFKRVPSAEASVEILPSTHPAAQPGDSDIVVHWSQARPLRLHLSLDDAGLRATGRLQSALTVALDHGLAWDVFVGAPLSQPRGFGSAGLSGGFQLSVGF